VPSGKTLYLENPERYAVSEEFLSEPLKESVAVEPPSVEKMEAEVQLSAVRRKMELNASELLKLYDIQSKHQQFCGHDATYVFPMVIRDAERAGNTEKVFKLQMEFEKHLKLEAQQSLEREKERLSLIPKIIELKKREKKLRDEKKRLLLILGQDDGDSRGR
jgi:hypothetical protein